MPSFKNLVDDKKNAEPGDVVTTKKAGGLTFDFSFQRFSETYLDSFIGHVKEAKVIERFDAIYSGEQANTTENRPVDHFGYRKEDSAREQSVLDEQEKALVLSEHINKQEYEAML